MSELHKRLIAKQSMEELKRKADKARRKNIWTQESLDYAARLAEFYQENIIWE